MRTFVIGLRNTVF